MDMLMDMLVTGAPLDAVVELEDESWSRVESSDGGGGVATVLPGRRRSALSGSLCYSVLTAKGILCGY